MVNPFYSGDWDRRCWTGMASAAGLALSIGKVIIGFWLCYTYRQQNAVTKEYRCSYLAHELRDRPEHDDLEAGERGNRGVLPPWFDDV